MKYIKLYEGLFATNEGRKLNTIFNALDYDDFEEFIGDNPGAFEVLGEWIAEHFGDDLKIEFDQEELEDLGIYLEYNEDYDVN